MCGFSPQPFTSPCFFQLGTRKLQEIVYQDILCPSFILGVVVLICIYGTGVILFFGLNWAENPGPFVLWVLKWLVDFALYCMSIVLFLKFPGKNISWRCLEENVSRVKEAGAIMHQYTTSTKHISHHHTHNFP